MSSPIPVPVLNALYRDLLRLPCEVCGAESVPQGSTCPRSLACPDCKAVPGSRCRRPSGHDASELHRARWMLAEEADMERLGDRLLSEVPRD